MKKRKSPFFPIGGTLLVKIRVPDYPGKFYWSVGVVVLDFKNRKYLMKIVDSKLGSAVQGSPKRCIKRLRGRIFRITKNEIINGVNKSITFLN